MNREEYLQYLIKEFNLPENSDECNLYGFFQDFRPRGEGIEKVFSPLKNGQKYHQRLNQIFENNIEDAETIHAYFVKNDERSTTDLELLKFGNEYLFRLKILAELINDSELTNYLNSIGSVEIGQNEKHEIATLGYDILYDVILDWIIRELDFESPIRVLDEAFYSIACDPWLQNYLMWIQFEQKGFIDVFEPYFELWKRGQNCYFETGKLIISKN